MEKIVELIWSGFLLIGSLLLAGDLEKKLSRTAKLGAALILVGFIIQTLSIFYNSLGISGAVILVVMTVIMLIIALNKKQKTKG